MSDTFKSVDDNLSLQLDSALKAANELQLLS